MNIRIYAQAENGKKDILSYSFIIREGFLGNKEFLKRSTGSKGIETCF